MNSNSRFAIPTLGTLLAATLMSLAAAPSNPGVNLDQCRNGAPGAEVDCVGSAWVNGNLNTSNSHYKEGDGVAFRVAITDLADGPHELVIDYKSSKGGRYAYDYLVSYNHSESSADPCSDSGIAACSGSPGSTLPIPPDPDVVAGSVIPASGNFAIWGGTLTGTTPYSVDGTFGTDSTTSIGIQFSVSGNPDVVIAWGGHLASRFDWGVGNSSSSISGSPFHMGLKSLDDESTGSQDRSIAPRAILVPDIQLVKTADPVVAGVGDTITYTFEVTNLGEKPLTDVTVTDQTFGQDVVLGTTTLEPSESTTGTIEYVVLEQDLPGPILNVALAEGSAGQNETVSDIDDAVVDLAAISLDKSADLATAAVGDDLTYTFVVTNTGGATLTDVSVFDDTFQQAVTLATTTLAAGESTEGTLAVTVAESHLPGPLENTATATGHAGEVEVTDIDDATVLLTFASDLTLVKQADRGTAGIGDTITYDYTVTNTGDVTLTGVTLLDDILGTIDLDFPTTDGQLAPSEVATGSATHTVTENDLPGPIVNVAIAAAVRVIDNQPLSAQDTESVALTSGPGISLTKEADVVSAEPGDTISYTYEITNTGNVTLYDVSLEDDVIGTIIPASLEVTLAPGESVTTVASYVVTAADALAGEVTNVAIATGSPQSGDDVSATAQASVIAVEVLPAVFELPATGNQSQALFTWALVITIFGWALLDMGSRGDAYALD